MKVIQLTVLLSFLFFVSVSAQDNFHYSPVKPNRGERVDFSYKAVGDLKSMQSINARAFMLTANGKKATDIQLRKEGDVYKGSVITDTATNLIYFEFTSEKLVDKAKNGYWIQMWEKDQIGKGSHRALSILMKTGMSVGMDKNPVKALEYLEKEFALYPDQKQNNLLSYARLLKEIWKDSADKMVLKEVEAFLKKGLNTEQDHILLSNLYNLIALPEHANLITSKQKLSYPQGLWMYTEEIKRFKEEQKAVTKDSLLGALLIKNNTAQWKELVDELPLLKSQLAFSYAQEGMWDEFHKMRSEIGNVAALYNLYNRVAWSLIKSEKLALAEELAFETVKYNKSQLAGAPVDPNGNYTPKEWLRQLEYHYAFSADLYATILYKLGKYDLGYKYAKEAALEISLGLNANLNSTYALLAEKALKPDQYIKQLERFVVEGKATKEIRDVLAQVYQAERRADGGFDKYYSGLEDQMKNKLLSELKGKMLDSSAPSFTLLDLTGKNVDLKAFKGKVVVLDFWATWCKPCIGSFPAMKKMINKHKDVVFLFIDSWESKESEKRKNAQRLMDQNQYSFTVLMDDEDKVVEAYKVEGLPTKVIIDKKGKMQFKTVGFSSLDHLVNELESMLQILKEN